ncbi:putative membrane protein [Streptomyces davaonensis JCM 4913]|uniref:Putative membrane protein n=1 Tax=Streptomyces davaonensis (strain DSM 101723 / JCM 4913 / KCC S-0913 / 768) TaxID=1214101 RepID=K4R7Q1_STRDJ|nr:putative membrane protein [Streptomyces davaonensis JCM 4913]
MLLGSPWMREPLYEFQPETPVVSMVHRALFVPTWDLSPSSEGLAEPLYLAGNTALIVLLTGAVLAPRLLTRSPASRGVRWLAAFGTAVFMSLVAAVASWAVVKADGDEALSFFGAQPDQVLVNFLVDGLVFGVLLGVALAAVLGGTGTRAAMSRIGSRDRERSSTMAPSSAPLSSDVPGGAVGSTAPDDTTRHLCAAAYTDPDFTRRVVEDVVRDELGAIASSPGVDLVPVVRHSLAARRLHRARDHRLAAVYLLIAVFGPLWLVYGHLSFKALAAACRAPRRAVRGREPVDTGAAVRWLAGTIAGVLLAGVLFGMFLSALPLSGVWSWLAGSYAKGVPSLLAVIGGGVWAFWIMSQEELNTDRLMRESLRRETFDAQARPESAAEPAWAAAGVRAMAEAQSGNVTVYSGFSPFIGQGVRQSQWALSLPLLPAGPGTPLTGFDTWDAVERLRARLREAAAQPPVDGGPDLGALEVEDRVFVSGTRLTGDRRLLPALLKAPAARLSDTAVRGIALDPQGTPRHCLAAHLPLWGGAVVPSQLLHIAVVGKTLHLHCDRHVLTPLRPDLRGVDLLPASLTPAHRAGLLLTALRRSGAALFGAPRAVVGDALREWGRPRRQRRERAAAQTDPAFDRGARLSVREHAMSAEYLDHFQRVDAERAFAALDRHALAAVRDFLDEHGVDTTDFRTQTQTILNHGVLQTGGVSVVGNQAVGQAAQATAHNATATAQAPQ